jgi:uncharacterized protein involved in high-affinity Fe2+ transport
MRIIMIALAAALALPALAKAQQAPAPMVEVLAAPADPRQKTILVGRSEAAGMVIQLEIEPATTMLMPMGAPMRLAEHAPQPGEVYHLEVKPIDPRSKTRIAYATVVLEAVNRDTGKSVKGELHPMWGGSGLHYASNSALVGDGTCDVAITVDPPTFARAIKDKALFAAPATARVHFKFLAGALVEVSDAIAAPD